MHLRQPRGARALRARALHLPPRLRPQAAIKKTLDDQKRAKRRTELDAIERKVQARPDCGDCGAPTPFPDPALTPDALAWGLPPCDRRHACPCPDGRRCFAGTEAAPWSSMRARGLMACTSRLGRRNARRTRTDKVPCSQLPMRPPAAPDAHPLAHG